MFGEIRFKKGDALRSHAHDNEQFTYVVDGALKKTTGSRRSWWPPVKLSSFRRICRIGQRLCTTR
jgi:hypothetical protein